MSHKTRFVFFYHRDTCIDRFGFAHSNLTSCRLSSHPFGDDVDVDVDVYVDVDVDVDVDGTSLVLFSPLHKLSLRFWLGCIEVALIGSMHTLRVAPFNCTVRL